jgi:hypothetical protein
LISDVSRLEKDLDTFLLVLFFGSIRKALTGHSKLAICEGGLTFDTFSLPIIIIGQWYLLNFYKRYFED